MSNTKFILIISIIFLLFTSIASVSATDTNASIVGESTEVEHTLGDINNSLENQEIYVNPLGCDDANGSFQNPVSSIHRAVEMAKNNSKIILMDGEYKGTNNTFILINKNLTIESFSNNVIINGENKCYSQVINTVYNYNKICIINSQVENLLSNNEYDEGSYKTASIIINNSKLNNIDFEDAFVRINVS